MASEYPSDGVGLLISNRWKIAAVIALIVLLYFGILIMLPLADGIVLGLVFAYIARPIRKKFKTRRKLGSLVASLCLFIPIIFIVGAGILEIINGVSWIIVNQAAVIGRIFDFVRSLNIPAKYLEEINTAVWNLFTSLLPVIGKIGLFSYAQSLGIFIINFIISMILCYFLLADGDKLYEAALRIIPQKYQKTVNSYASHLDTILKGIFVGNAYAALSVSISSVIVFSVFGIPHVLALSTLIFIASVIPLFAGYMVLLPLAIVRYFQFGLESAVTFMVLSSIVIYGPPELILRPYLTSLKSNIHPMLLMLAFLGGAFVGGIAGFFAAPILLGSLVAAYRVYQELMDAEDLQEVNSKLKKMEYSRKPDKSEKET